MNEKGEKPLSSSVAEMARISVSTAIAKDLTAKNPKELISPRDQDYQKSISLKTSFA